MSGQLRGEIGANTTIDRRALGAGTPAEPRTEYLRSLARIRRLK
ncbi:MAG TPA: hypothetical protein VN734_15590 [Acidobacteriaceae bacterium]|nr:hypothetical protein [Acidobacteriaceae bacterium]